MISLLRRLFRRTPAHLRGRVPVDCGEGTEPADAAWIASSDRLNRYVIPPEPECHNHGLHAHTMDQHFQHHPEEAEPPRYVRRELGNGWVTHTLVTAKVQRPAPGAPAALMAQRAANLERAADMAQRQRETPQEAAMMRNNSRSDAWALGCLYHRYEFECDEECSPRPKPAENARRYTHEDGTW